MPVNVAQAVDLKINHNLSYGQIAAIQGVTKPAILKRIRHLLPTELTDVWKSHRADILSHAQLRLLSGVTDDKIKKAPAGSLVLAACQLYDKERIERGLSTSNVAMIHEDIQGLRGYAAARQSGGDPVPAGKMIDITPVDNQAQKSPTNKIKGLP